MTDNTSNNRFVPAPPLGYVEQGHMFERLSASPDAGHASDRDARDARQRTGTGSEAYDVVVIGAGQAGLSVGYFLKRAGLRFLILDAEARVGDVWRKRWDSLRLFTACRWDGLPGFAWPAAQRFEFPTKDQMADYLESYAAHFELPIRTGTRVERVTRRSEGYVVRAGGRDIVATNVIVAMATYQRPYTPDVAKSLRPHILQLHSRDYKNPSQLRPGPVLIVGAGNSGAELAMELSKSHTVLMSGRDVGYVPFKIAGFWGRLLCVPLLLRVIFHRILTVNNPIGRKVRAKIMHHGAPLIRVRKEQLVQAGVERVARLAGVSDGFPQLEDGSVVEPTNVVWCTGYRAGTSFIELPIFDENGEPRHESGVVPEAPGLYFVGLHFLHAMSSSMIHGVARDAERIAKTVAAKCRQSQQALASAGQAVAISTQS